MEGKNIGKKNLFSITSGKPIREFIESFSRNTQEVNFGVRYVFDMGKEYKEHNVDVSDDFELYQVILCNFDKSYKTMKRNMETAAVLLQPKQIVVYRNKGVTTVNYLPFTEGFIKEALPEDEKIQASLPASCRKIIELIEKSA